MKFIFLLISFSISFCLFSQRTTWSKKSAKIYKNAQYHVRMKKYKTAKLLLKDAIRIDNNFIEAWISLGEINFILDQKKEAIDVYNHVINIDSFNFPSIYYKLGKIQYSIGKYENAIKNLSNYIDFNNISPEFKKHALSIIKSSKFAKDAILNPVTFDPESLGPNINSDYDEYLPAISADGTKLIFTRSKYYDGKRNEDFYYSEFDGDSWSLSKDFGEPINSELNEGAQCISPDGKILYFTACGKFNTYGGCDLYKSYFKNNVWSEPINLGSNINSKFWESQPSISADGNRLFFVSNRDGGFGGKDIWMSYKNLSGEWSKPINLGIKINTSKDEISPFIHFDNQTLYFSSKGHLGMGGFDVFYSKLSKSGDWNEVKNIGYPINSHLDENSMIVAKDGRTAYFTSINSNSNLDIYSFELPIESRAMNVAYFNGKIFDGETNLPIECNLELINLDTGDTFMDSESQSDGSYFFCLPSNSNFALNINKELYLFHSENISIAEKGSILMKNYKLYKLKVGNKVKLDNIFFKFNSYDLSDKSITEINQIITFMNDNPFLKIEIGGHTDNIGSKKYNLELSSKRAKSLKYILIKRGIDEDRIETKGYGMNFSLNSNLTKEERLLNRRTELKIISIK